MNTLKKILTVITVILSLSFLTVPRTFAQPEDLSFLTNRASLASWALKQVKEIEVQVYEEAGGAPSDGSTHTNKTIAYSGPASFTGIAKALTGTAFAISTPIPDSVMTVGVNLKGNLPDGGKQYLFGGWMSGKPEYDGEKWRLPKDAGTPSMYLEYNIFIPVPGLVKAWVVETNAWGWAVKKELPTSENGFWIDSSLAGEVYLVLEVMGKGGTTTSVYDLHSKGKRTELPVVIAAVSIRDSEDVRDYGNNATELSHWVFTFNPGSSLTYGKVPLLVATYTENVSAKIWVGSAVGYARKFIVNRLSEQPGGPEARSVIEVPAGQEALNYLFKPGVYHIIPLGINVCPDWWKLLDVYGTGEGKG